MTQQPKHLYEFGPYRVDPAKRLLLRGEESVPLPSKVFETLLVLVQRRQEVVSKDDLLKTIWPDSFVEESNLSQSIFLLRKALGETAQDHRYIVTIPGRGYRFVEKVEEIREEANDLVVESYSVKRVTVEETGSQQERPAAISFAAKLHRERWIGILGSAGVVVALALAAVWAFRTHRPPPLNEADLVLVADFVNTTGEPVFDGSLKEALTVKLAESPYFNIVPGSRTRETLKLMGRSSDERVVPSIARDLCQREGAKLVVGGSIVGLGNKYVLDLDATNCLTGNTVAHQEIDALNRDQVLSKLGQVIPQLRRKLGESVSSIQKFDTPIEQATTKSLTALKAYTKGQERITLGHEQESIPLYETAIELDPNFAMAYAGLASVNTNLQQPDLAAEYLRKAFALREHASEKEKLDIQALYYSTITREFEKVLETYKLWAEAYPHDYVPFVNLGNQYAVTGQMEEAIAASQQALRLNPDQAISYAGLGAAYQRASRFAEAKTICEKAVTEKLDSWTTHRVLYMIAFVEGDGPAMQKEVDWFKGKPTESVGTYYQAKAALSLGQLRASRTLFERARSIALEHGLKEQAIAITNGRAQFEADLGNAREARAMADLSLRESPNSVRHKAFATLALARAGDAQRAEALLRELEKQPPVGTAMNEVVFPSVRAAVDLDHRNPVAAIEKLRHALPYDLGVDSAGVTVYYRGLAYLELKSGKEAAEQFQKILDNRGVVAVDIYWPLAHLGLARAYAQTRDTEKSLTQYREFLELWKDADPDLPVLNLAKAEYKKIAKQLRVSP